MGNFISDAETGRCKKHSLKVEILALNLAIDLRVNVDILSAVSINDKTASEVKKIVPSFSF